MKIFEPITINHLKIKNRLMVSAMVTNYCKENGYPTEKFIAYHEHKAKGGFGLIITEDYAISPAARGFKRLPGLWENVQIPAHQELTRRVHAVGGNIFCQIYHAGRQTSSEITGVQCVAPSAVADPTVKEIPHALSIDEIHTIEEQFISCAVRAKAAGFDGVEVHGAHGYLIGQFNSPFSNKRTDIYGGSIRNRARFMTEIIQKIRKACGNDFPIQFRMSAQEYVEGGIGIEDAKVIAMLAQQAGADSIHVSQGVYSSSQVIIPPSYVQHGAFVNNAAEIKKVVDVPVITVGRINDPLLAEAIIKSGKADMCTMGRASIADPEMPNKAREGRFDDIIYCVGCLQGCNGEEMRGNKVRCILNPLVGMEDEYKITPASPAKNVLVVGGGVAGCEAAIMAAQRGHKVTVLEKSNELGGQWIAASTPVGKGDFGSFVAWQAHTLEKLHVKVVLNTDVTKEIIDSYRPDVVLLANGSVPSVPPVAGLAQFGVYLEDILRGRKSFGQKVVVIGGGSAGAETADQLANNGATDVSIIEMTPNIVSDGEESAIYYLKRWLDEKHVHVYTSAKVSKVTKDSVNYLKNGETSQITGIDTIVIATGRKNDNTLLDSLQGAAYQVSTIGDAKKPKSGYLDIKEGYEAGISI